jgi:hypothetical protein
MLREAIAQAGNGGRPMMVLDAASATRVTGPAAIDGIGPTEGWQSYWRDADAAKRRQAPWTASAA